MNLSPIFWSAFLAGLAAPAGLYAETPAYGAYVADYSVARSFGVAGAYLTEVSQRELSVGPPEQFSFEFT